MSVPLSFSLLFLFCLALSGSQGATPYYLQVGHQSPKVASENLFFIIDGQTILDFQNISYGSGSVFVDVTGYVDSKNPTVDIEVFDRSGNLIIESELTLTRAFHSYFVINLRDERVRSIYYSWETHYPTSATWFIFINLAPSHYEEVTVSVNDDALVETLDYLEPSDVYTSVAGAYVFVASSKTSQLATNTFQLQPGAIETIILNDDLNGGLTLFKLKDWQSIYRYSALRAVQTVPDKKAYVWLGGEESWQGLSYKTVTDPEKISATETDIYVSITTTKPATPTLTYTFVGYLTYSLLISGDPDNGVALSASVLVDTNFAPVYNMSSARVAYVPPSGLPVEVFLNDQDLGSVNLNEATEYALQEPSDSDTNVTITNRQFTYEDAISEDEFETGSAYTIFVVGTYDVDPNKNEMDLVLALDFASADIEKLEDQFDNDDDDDDSDDDDDDDDDDDGLSGGAIAGIVIGVLFGVGLLVGAGLYVRKRAHHVPSQADYESIPTNNFL